MPSPSPSSEPHLEESRHIAVRAVVSFLLVILVLGIAIGLAVVLFITGPKPEKADDGAPLPPVETMPVKIRDYPVEILTRGMVESRRETRISAELAGRVAGIGDGFRRGGRVRQGELLVSIEPADYVAALATARSALADAELALAQEEARSEQARLDWERLGNNRAASPLVLRVPQLAAARARVDSTMAAVVRAERDVERTSIHAPFDASIRSVAAEVGTVTRPGEPIAELFADNDLEIRLPLTLEEFGFLETRADGGIDGTITLSATLGGRDHEWAAEPVKIDSEIDRSTRSAHLIARVLPNGDGTLSFPPVGLFVAARVTGTTLGEVAVVPRRALREGGEVIVVTPENRIEFRAVEVARTTRDLAVIRSGLAAGERICLTRLNAPVAGMEVADTTTTTPNSDAANP